MQAIHTKYLPTTNHKGSRVKASCQAGSLTISWNHALNSEQNHCAVASKLAEKYGWKGKYIGGGNPNNSGYTFVSIDSYVSFVP